MNEEKTVDLKEVCGILKKRIWLILIITIIAAIVSGIIVKCIMEPKYKADISVIVFNTKKNEKELDNSELDMYRKLVTTYTKLTVSRRVLDDVIDELNLSMGTDKLKSMISAIPERNSEFLTITVKSKNKKQVAKIANQVARSLKRISKKILKIDNIKIVDYAQKPKHPCSPRIIIDISLAAFVALIVSILIAFILEWMDNTVKTEEELKEILQTPVIGALPLENK